MNPVRKSTKYIKLPKNILVYKPVFVETGIIWLIF